jgi:hypothetical protein
MRLDYRRVSAKRIWHILRLYHRTVMWSSDSEALCEHVGSVMRFVEKKHGTGRPLDTATLVKATRLRADGVRGDGCDVGCGLGPLFGGSRLVLPGSWVFREPLICSLGENRTEPIPFPPCLRCGGKVMGSVRFSP